MLSRHEKRNAYIVLLVSILGAGAQVAMISAVMPFLTFVADPTGMSENAALSFVLSLLPDLPRYQVALILGGLCIAAILAANVVLLARSYAISRFTVMRIHSISTKLLKSYLARPYEYFLGRNSGDLAKRVLSETSEISTSFLQPAAEMISSIISAVFILGFLIYLEPKGTLIGVAVIAIFYLTIYRHSRKYISQLGKARAAANENRFRTINEIFGGLKDVKIHQKEDAYLKSFEAASATMMKANWKSRIASDMPQFFVQAFFLSGVILACLALIDPTLFNSGISSSSSLIPTMGVFAFAGQRVVPELQKIYNASSKMNFGAAALSNVSEDILQTSQIARISPDYIAFEDRLSLQNIVYHYPGATAGLNDISLTIKKGQRIGIVGGSGAGKTTLVDVILGLLHPHGGDISIDGHILATPQQIAGWQNRVAYVPQSIFIADASFAENIAFGEPFPQIDMDRVVAAAETARIHDFIRDSKAGYAGRTGDRGVSLSGGQKQRIGIARALYKGADLIVLDEATSALDGRTESEVMEAIDSLPGHVTVMMIAHRLDTLKTCDRIFVLDKGRIAEEGSWSDLERRGGAFAAMLKH